MSRTYRCEIKEDPDKFIARAKKLARENGVEVEGNDELGTVRIRGVNGDFNRKGDAVVITIRKKPPLIPWFLLENQLAKFFGCPVERK